MSSVSQYHNLLKKGPWISLFVVLLCSFALLYAYYRLPDFPQSAPDKPDSMVWPEHHDILVSNWSVFQGEAGTPSGKGELAKQFRFAGAFFLSGGGQPDMRKAVLDETGKNVQHIVSEGDSIGDVKVAGVYRDRVVLSLNGVDEELWLSLEEASLHSGDTSSTGNVDVAGEDCRFGKKVGDNNWLFKRQALMDYYDELMNEPERLLKVFDSLKPMRNRKGKIKGYILDIEGEKPFFDAIGFKEGDVVRKVNEMPMTSRHRAEFFIKQFVDNKLSVILIDLERGGDDNRLVYRVR